MSYLTLEVQIDQGKVLPKEPEKLPEQGHGLLTILESGAKAPNSFRLEAFHALQQALNLDDSKAKAWVEAIRDARR